MYSDPQRFEQTVFGVEGYVTSTQMNILSQKEIQEFICINPKSIDQQSGDISKNMGLLLGSHFSKDQCQTCGLYGTFKIEPGKTCMGHMGYIRIERPIYNLMILKTHLIPVLQIFCSKCSKFVAGQATVKRLVNMYRNDETALIQNVRAKSKIRFCRPCGETICKKIKIEYQKQEPILWLVYENTQIEYNTKHVLKTLLNISQEDWILLFPNAKYRPTDLIFHSAIPVPPPHVRPISTDPSKSGQIYQHKITTCYKNILKNVGTDNINNIYNYLRQVFGLKQIVGQGQNSNTITDRLKGKQSVYRANCLGRRLTNCARNVIGSDVSLQINDVSLPYTICQKLFISEEVNQQNLKLMQKLLENGYNKKYPSITRVITQVKDQKVTLVVDQPRKVQYQLKIGDTVMRTLMTGDYVFIVRFPTLHRPSMMLMRVKVTDGYLMQINPCICTPFNADFDGDEMNIYVIAEKGQLIQAVFTHVPKQNFISTSTLDALIQPGHDAVCGIFRLSLAENIRPDILQRFNNYIPIKSGKQSGYDVIANILETDNYPAKELIKRGMTKGDFNKMLASLYAAAPNKLYPIQLLKQLADIAYVYLDVKLITFGYFDFNIGFDKEAHAKKIQEIQHQIELIKTSRQNAYYSNKDSVEFASQEDIELIIKRMIARLDSEASTEVYQKLSKNPESGLYQMITSGSKGNKDNARTMIAHTGQQTIRGYRILPQVNNRLSAHYPVNGFTLQAMSFISDPLVKGISDQTLLLSAMANARMGEIQTHLETAKTGYFYRKTSTAQRNVITGWSKDIWYGGLFMCDMYCQNGFDNRYQHRQQLQCLKLNNDQIRDKYFPSEDLQDLYNQCISIRNILRMNRNYSMFDGSKVQDFVYFPLDINISIQKWVLENKANKGFKLSVQDYKQVIIRFVDSLNPIWLNGKERSAKTMGDMSYSRALLNYQQKQIFKLLILEKLSYPFVQSLGVQRDGFEKYFQFVNKQLSQCTISPGETVGIVSAQNLGEIATQNSLSSFHKISANMNFIQNLDRLLDNRRDASSYTVLKLKKEFRHDKKYAEQILNFIKQLSLTNILQSLQIFFDPFPRDPKYGCAYEDNMNFDEGILFDKQGQRDLNSNTISAMIASHNILVRLDKGLNQNVDSLLVISKILRYFAENYNTKKMYNIFQQCIILLSHDKSKIHLRIRPNIQLKQGQLFAFVTQMLQDIIITGYTHVRNAKIESVPIVTVAPNGELQTSIENHIVIENLLDSFEQVRQLKYVDIDRSFSTDMKMYQQHSIYITIKVINFWINILFEKQGYEIMPQHTLLVALVKCYTDKVLPYKRTSIQKMPDQNAESVITFENSIKFLTDAAIRGSVSFSNTNINAALMMNARPEIGTAFSHLDYDNELETIKLSQNIVYNFQRKYIKDHIENSLYLF